MAETGGGADADARPRAVPLQLLAQRQFLLTWLAGAFAGVIRWLDVLAIGVYVLEVTGSALMVALTLFVRMVPMLLFGAVVGAIAELVDRRKLLITGLIGLAGVYGLMGVLALNGSLQIWQMAIGVFLGGVFWSMELPVRRTMIVEIAGLERIGPAMGLDSSTNNLTRMVGPFIGGFVYEMAGLPGTMAIGAALYLVAALLLTFVDYGRAPGAVGTSSILANIIEGLRQVRANRTIAGVLVITVFLNLFGFSYVSMVPVIARQELGLSPFPTGVLMSAEGLGAFIGALLIAFLAQPRRFNQLYLGGAILYLCCIIVFTLSPWFELSLGVLWIGGFGISGFAAMQSALIIAASPPAMRNRIMGVLAMCIGFGPLGILLTGLLADQLGASTAVLITATTGLFAMIGAGLYWPEMRRLREVAPVSGPPAP